VRGNVKAVHGVLPIALAQFLSGGGWEIKAHPLPDAPDERYDPMPAGKGDDMRPIDSGGYRRARRIESKTHRA
jgi:hypothetical protein